MEDFAYSDVHLGIAPGDTFEKRLQLPASDLGPKLPTLYLLSVLLEGGKEDGDSRFAQKIKDERLGEKIQIHRALKILKKQAKLPKDRHALKGEVDAALTIAESEALVILSELQPATSVRRRNKLSDELRQGLQLGREKMLQRLEALEHFPGERQEKAFTELKTRASDLLTRL